MTTYILCGGNDRKYDQFGVKLAKELSIRTDSIKLLDVYFAGEASETRARYEEWGRWFDAYFPPMQRTLATRENFREQLRECNVVYVHGGRTANLLEALPDFAELKKSLAGKIYIGSSAGTNYIAEHFLSHRGATQGSSILPINVVVHYEASDLGERRSEQAADELAVSFPDVRTLRIREGDFEVIEDE